MRVAFYQQRVNTVIVVFFAVCFCSPLFAAPSTQQWVDQLHADDPSDRDAAEAHLLSAGKDVIGPLAVAASDPCPEVRDRALRDLRRIRLLSLPDVPANVLSIARDYLDAADNDHRKAQLNLLFQVQPAASAVLTRLVALESNEYLQQQILYRLGIGYRDQVSRILADDNDPQQVFTLLNGAALMWGQAEAADNALVHYLSGTAEQQIQICMAEQANGDSAKQERASRQLCFLYRVCGKFDLALKAARQSKEQTMIFLVLADQGDWDTAAKETDERWHDPVLTSAFRSAFQRLAGNREQGLDTMNAIAPLAAPDSDDSYTPSKYFLLNDSPSRGMEMMVERHPAAVFSMRVERHEIPQALEIARKYAGHPEEGPALLKMRDDLRRKLGELPDLPVAELPAARGPLWDEWQIAVTDLAQKRFQKAADEFGAMWEADHTHIDRLYLQGYALNAAGQKERGQALMHTVEMIPLGDPLKRWQLATQLDFAGLSDAAEAQRDLALRTGGDYDEIGFSEVYNTRAENAMEHQQWHAAAEAIDRLCLINLSPQVQWHDPTRLLTIPALAHLLKSRDLREHGDLSAAMRELQAYQQYLPASADMVLEYVPALDELGEHHKADELFNSAFEKLIAICRAYPKSVAYQNQLAWMCACCGRKLDDALAAADTATKIKPGNWQTMDTLAEVNFRRGDRQRAVEIEKQAAALSNNPYLVRQLKRFENAAVPSTTQPGVAPE